LYCMSSLGWRDWQGMWDEWWNVECIHDICDKMRLTAQWEDLNIGGISWKDAEWLYMSSRIWNSSGRFFWKR
jgi:hypothetical protein